MVADNAQARSPEAPPANPDDRVLRIALDAIEELKGESIKVLEISRLTTIADHMVVCSGRSARHVKRIGETVIVRTKAAGLAPRVEGLDQSEWVLIDLNGVLVHIMQPMTRAYYQVEKLWDVDIPGPDASTNAL